MTAGHAYTFGMEEEFFLVRPATRRAPPHVPKGFLKLCRRHFGDLVDSELMQSQIEIRSPVFDGMAAARDEMTRFRRGVAGLAGSVGLAIVAAGTHPLNAWQQQAHTDKPRYSRIIRDFQMVGRRSQVCGLHVHVAPPADVDRVVLMNRLMRWMPLFLAISTSSPFWNRRHTGLLGYRQSAYDEWPRSGIPDFFADEAEYRTFCDLLTKAGAIKDPGFMWWAIRPSHRYPTLELRIADACTHLDDALALAALFRCLVRAHVRQPRLGAARTALTRRIIDENRWRAKRFGLDARFIDEQSGTAVDGRHMLDNAIELVSEDAQQLDCGQAMRHLGTIASRGTSAQEQLAVYRGLCGQGASNTDALRGVVDWLIEASVAVADQ
ncbi:MAG: carboxylate-amine ligase [Rhodanobacter sp.]